MYESLSLFSQVIHLLTNEMTDSNDFASEAYFAAFLIKETYADKESYTFETQLVYRNLEHCGL